MENYVWNGLPARGDDLRKVFFDPQAMTARPSLHLSDEKACKQCYATKTPQWREGPDGPKTLCNACGVKYCRQKKKASGGKPKSAARQSHHTVLTVQAPPRQQPAPGMFHNYSQELAEQEIPARPRTQRKAAEKARTKTAEYAASGDWPNDDGVDGIALPVHRFGCDAVLRTAYSADSDSAEELNATPGKFSHDMVVHVGHPVGFCRRPPSPGSARQSDEASAAAASLLYLARAPQKSEDLFQVGPLQTPVPSNAPSSSEDLAVEDELLLIKDDLDRTLRDVHVAETVAAAVAEVLAHKQSLATFARKKHQQVLKRMRDFTMTLAEHEDVDVMPQLGKRRRVSY